MQYQVYRTDYSSYMSEGFRTKERELIESFSELQWSEKYPKKENILITNSSTKVEDIPFQVMANCKLIIHPNSGYDNYSIDFIQSTEAPILNGNLIREQAVSEYIISCLMHHTSPITNQSSWQQSRRWVRPLVNEKRIQVIGYGNIGQKVSACLKALNCKKLAIYDPYAKDLSESKVLNKIDILILACGLNKDNEGFINSTFFEKLSHDALIINAARGPLIVEEDLVKFLTHNPKSYAYLDVFEKEPFEENHLGHLKNLVKTSHIAGCSASLEDKILDFEKEVLKNFLESKNFDKIYQSSILKNKIIDQTLI